MDKNKEKVVGYLLDALKNCFEVRDSLLKNAAVLKQLGNAQDQIWQVLKMTVGMPEKEEIGVFVSDIWLDIALSYVDDKLYRHEAIEKIMNWNNGFDH